MATSDKSALNRRPGSSPMKSLAMTTIGLIRLQTCGLPLLIWNLVVAFCCSPLLLTAIAQPWWQNCSSSSDPMDLDADGFADVSFWSQSCSWVDENGVTQWSYTNGLTSTGLWRPVDPVRTPLGARLDSTNPAGFVPLSGSPNEFWGEFLALTLKQGNGSVRYGWRRDIRGSRGSSQFEQELAVGTNQPIELGLPAEPRWLPKLANGLIPLPPTTQADRQSGILRRFGNGERDFNSGVASIGVAPDGRIWGVAVAGPLYSDAGKHTNVLFSVRADGGDWQNHRDLVSGTERVPSSVSVTRAGLVFVHVATTQTMLFRYDPVSGELTNVRSLGGMSKALLSEVVQLSDDTLCVTTADGFYRLQSDGTGPVFHSLAATGLKNFNRGVTQGNDGWLYVLGQTGGEGDRGGIVRCRPDGTEASLWYRFPFELSYSDPNQSRSALTVGSDGHIYGTAAEFFYIALYRFNADGPATVVGIPPHYRRCWSPRPMDCGVNGHLHALYGRPVEHDGYFYGTVAGGWDQGYGLAGVYRTPLPRNADLATPAGIEVLTQNSEIPWWGSTYRWIKTADGTLLSPSDSGIISFRPGQHGLRPIRTLGSTGSDGNTLAGPLVRDGEGRLFGVSRYGGVVDAGTIFLASEDGATNAILHSFTGSEGDVLNPSGSLVRGADGWLYGTSRQGDRHDFSPKLYRLHPADGTFEVVATLPGGHDGDTSTRSGLMAAGNGLLYGTTTRGGGADLGTIFLFDPASRTLRIVHEISGAPGHRWRFRPELLQGEDGFIYGLAEGSGPDQEGDDGVFRLALDGTGFQVIARIVRPRPDIRLAGGLVEATDGNLYVARGIQSSTLITNEICGEILRIIRGQLPVDPARMEVALTSKGGDEPEIAPGSGLTVTADGWLMGLSHSTSTAVYRWHCVTGELQRRARTGSGLMTGLTTPPARSALIPPLKLADDSVVIPAFSYLPAPRYQPVLCRLPLTNSIPPQALAEVTVQTGYGVTISRRFSPLFTNACALSKIIGAETCLKPGFYTIDASSIYGAVSAAGNHRIGVVADDCMFPARTATNWINLTVTPGQLRLTGRILIHAVGSTNWLPTGAITGLLNDDRITVDWITSATSNSPAGVYAVEPVLRDPDGRLINYQVTTNFGSIKLVDPKVRPSVDSSGLVLNFPGIPGKKITVEQTDRLDKPVWVKTHGFTILSETPPTVTIPPDDAHPTRFVRVTME